MHGGLRRQNRKKGRRPEKRRPAGEVKAKKRVEKSAGHELAGGVKTREKGLKNKAGRLRVARRDKSRIRLLRFIKAAGTEKPRRYI